MMVMQIKSGFHNSICPITDEFLGSFIESNLLNNILQATTMTISFDFSMHFLSHSLSLFFDQKLVMNQLYAQKEGSTFGNSSYLTC